MQAEGPSGDVVGDLVRAGLEIPGTYGYSVDDGEGHIFVGIWRLEGGGAAANMGRMSRWEYTWRLTGDRDGLGRPVILLEPAPGNPTGTPRELVYDEGAATLCPLDSAEPVYGRLADDLR